MKLRSLSLRARVALAAAAAIVLALILLGGAVLALLGGQLRRSLDDTLEARAGEVARISATTPALLTAPDALEGRLGGQQLLVQVIDRQGRILARSIALGGRVLPTAEPTRRAVARGERGFADVRLGTEPLRLFAAPLPLVGGSAAAGGAIVVAASTSEVDGTLDRLRQLVVLAALIAAALAAGLGVALARGALSPLARLSAAARGIADTGDASRRLPAVAARDEVGELAETLNAMLASLERAREAERRFVGDASHELRTPLTALRGNAAYVARHGADAEALADIERDAARLGDLLDRLLALAREDAGEAPAELVRLDLLALDTAGGSMRVDVEAPAPVTVRGDPLALERALENLIENAERHGPREGAIRVVVGVAGGRARLSVRDEGPGPPPAEAERAFERFRRGAGAGGAGSGLGLAIVRATAERHGGRVEVEGSTFTIDLPAVEGSAAIRELSGGAATMDAEARTGEPT